MVTLVNAQERNYSKAFENAGKPNYIDYETYIKDFIPKSKQQKLINKFLNTKYCLNK